MPRQGTRPYECVRRAWHSDRHQPLRGSLIQEIFRVVNEIHSLATRKNKEWQDKLPIVVLKAEEIMYSKANSEAEYVDLNTLWDRANDAINTIIRLDESTETGVFLQPCIEAALNLGCTPMRTSRSQRNNTSTYYLNIKNTESNFCPSNNLPKTAQEAPMAIMPFVSHYTQIMKPRSINLSPFGPKSQIPILPNNKSLRSKFPFPSSPNDKPFLCQNTKAPLVYPLYYGNGAPFKENGEMGFILKPSFCNPESGNGGNQADLGYTREERPCGQECDLSLRLGPSVMNNVKQIEPHDVGHLDNLISRKWRFESEKLDVEATMKKRKAVVSGLSEDLQFCWRPNISPSNPNGGPLTNGGL